MKPLSFLCCSVLRDELRPFLADNYPEAELLFLDSMLHMRPQRLEETLDRALGERAGRRCVLVYGDCHPRMREAASRPGCARTQGVNCGELLLGHQRYRQLRRAGAFLFLPEWTRRWREVFVDQLGFIDVELARQFMRESRQRLLYLDTGREPVPYGTLDDIETFFAMPVEVLPVALDHLQKAVRAATALVE